MSVAKAEPAAKAAAYHVVAGLNYVSSKTGEPRRVEPGEHVSDLPADAVGWLMECGAIRHAARGHRGE